MKRPIAIGLSPNTTKEDISLALSLFFQPWRYKNGQGVLLLEQWFRQHFYVSHAISFASGRASLYVILQALGIGKNDEVIMPSFSCAVVANAIVARGARPVYVDIAADLNSDPKKIEQAITKQTKAILVQHTFGIPADMDKLLAISKKHSVPLIEDAAHVVGGTWKGKLLGTFGIVGFFSFGRDKAFSSVFGGMCITNDSVLGKKIRAIQRVQKNPSFFWIAQQLFHPIAFAVALPFYDILSLGKALIVVLQKLRLLSFPVTTKEKNGGFEEVLLAKLPNALAQLALVQLRKIKTYNTQREAIIAVYKKELSNPLFSMPYTKDGPLLRFPLLVQKDRDEIITYMRSHHIYIGKWYAAGIDPMGVDYKKIFYQRSNYPATLAVAHTILNLPTYPTMTVADAKNIVALLNNYGNH